MGNHLAATLTVRGIAEKVAERCSEPDIHEVTDSFNEERATVVIESAIRAAAAPLVEALGDVLWLIDSGSVVLPDDDGPNTVTAREVCTVAHAALAAFKAQDETCDDPRIYPCIREGCTTMRNKAEGGTTFTVCDEHWEDKPTPCDGYHRQDLPR